jgi:hypothetical protein
MRWLSGPESMPGSGRRARRWRRSPATAGTEGPSADRAAVSPIKSNPAYAGFFRRPGRRGAIFQDNPRAQVRRHYLCEPDAHRCDAAGGRLSAPVTCGGRVRASFGPHTEEAATIRAVPDKGCRDRTGVPHAANHRTAGLYRHGRDQRSKHSVFRKLSATVLSAMRMRQCAGSRSRCHINCSFI